MPITISGTTGIDAGSLPVANTGKISAGSGLPAILNTAGVDRVTVDTSGNVGIGTNSPTTKMHIVEGDLRVESSSASPTIQLTDTGVANSYIYMPNGSNALAYNVGGAERMRIDSSGRVTMPYQPAFIAVGISVDVATDAPLVFVTNHASVPSQRSSGYSTSTGAFTAPVSGFYQFNFTAYDFNTGDKSTYEVRKNGGYYSVAGDHFQMLEATDAAMTTWSFNIYLQVNDYIQMGKRAGTLNLYSGHTMWSGYLIG